MPNNIGFSFQPGSQSLPLNGGARPTNGPQSAVQLKSLTLPNRFVPGQLAPQQLLQSPGGGGAAESNVLRMLMQAFAPQGGRIAQPPAPQPAMGQPDEPAGNGYQDWMRRERGNPWTMAPQPGAPREAPPEVPLQFSPGLPPHFAPGGDDHQGGPGIPEPPPFDLGDMLGGTPGGAVRNPHFQDKYGWGEQSASGLFG